MRDPFPLPVHALVSNSPRARARLLLHLLEAEPLCDDRWRLPGGTVIRGDLDDFVRSVDSVKQIEDWLIARQEAQLGDSEMAIAVDCCGGSWNAEITPYVDGDVISSPALAHSEARARAEMLIAYLRQRSNEKGFLRPHNTFFLGEPKLAQRGPNARF